MLTKSTGRSSSVKLSAFNDLLTVWNASDVVVVAGLSMGLPGRGSGTSLFKQSRRFCEDSGCVPITYIEYQNLVSRNRQGAFKCLPRHMYVARSDDAARPDPPAR